MLVKLVSVKYEILGNVQVYYQLEQGDLDEDHRDVAHHLSHGVGGRAVERAGLLAWGLHLPVKTYKLLCFSMTGRCVKTSVSSARASRALKRRTKNMTPPRVKTPALYIC